MISTNSFKQVSLDETFYLNGGSGNPGPTAVNKPNPTPAPYVVIGGKKVTASGTNQNGSAQGVATGQRG